MRVIAGTARGRTLKGPASTATRPTSDLVRGVIFSMLEARGAEFARVLDLYAGTGALGIEALSRGAEWADFVERDRAACAVITANLDHTGFRDRSHVIRGALPAALDRLSGAYSLVLCDPPYAEAGLAEVQSGPALTAAIDAGTTIVYEHDRRTMPPEEFATLPRQITRRHGDTAVSLYYRPDEAWEPSEA
jgi:16S rRNA (guanine966-N2)-methyltransferase